MQHYYAKSDSYSLLSTFQSHTSHKWLGKLQAKNMAKLLMSLR